MRGAAHVDGGNQYRSSIGQSLLAAQVLQDRRNHRRHVLRIEAVIARLARAIKHAAVRACYPNKPIAQLWRVKRLNFLDDSGLRRGLNPRNQCRGNLPCPARLRFENIRLEITLQSQHQQRREKHIDECQQARVPRG